MVDESHYNLHRHHNNTVCVLSGAFTPQFPVFDSRSRPGMRAIAPPGFRYERERRQVFERYMANSEKQHLKQDPSKVPTTVKREAPLYVTGLFCLRDEIMRYYHLYQANIFPWLPRFLTGSQEFYDRIVEFMCPNFQFNSQTAAEIAEHKREHVIPTSLLNNGTTSVAFHIRRGDKIVPKTYHGGNVKNLRDLYMLMWHSIKPRGESRYFAADAYVKKFLSVSDTGNAVDHCLVTSDDYQAVKELKESLKRHKVQCQVHLLTAPSERGYGKRNTKYEGDESLHFFAQMSLMIDALVYWDLQ